MERGRAVRAFVSIILTAYTILSLTSCSGNDDKEEIKDIIHHASITIAAELKA